jgi:hypothetical protein
MNVKAEIISHRMANLEFTPIQMYIKKIHINVLSSLIVLNVLFYSVPMSCLLPSYFRQLVMMNLKLLFQNDRICRLTYGFVRRNCCNNLNKITWTSQAEIISHRMASLDFTPLFCGDFQSFELERTWWRLF